MGKITMEGPGVFKGGRSTSEGQGQILVETTNLDSLGVSKFKENINSELVKLYH